MLVEVAIGSVSNRNYVFPVNEVPDKIKINEELYCSYYRFDDELKEHYKIAKSIKGYRGKFYINRLLFDIDKSKDTNEGVLKRAKMFVEKLRDEWKVDEDNIRISYSGTGYHIETPDIFGFEPSSTLPMDVKGTLTKYFGEADDIYDGPRLIRVLNSYNMKCGLYKIHLTLEELFHSTVTEIQALAVNSRQFESTQFTAPQSTYKDLIITYSKEIKVLEIDEPTRIVTCVQKLFNEGEASGGRHIKMLRIVSSYRRAGIPKEACYAIMEKCYPTLEPYDIHRSVDDIFKKRYQYACTDPIMNAHCDEKCIFWKKKDYTQDVSSAEDTERNYHKFMNTDFSKTSFDLGAILRLDNKFMIYPKEFVVIEGDTGTNKSTWLQNILVNLPMRVLSIQTENSPELFYRRNVQIKYGLTKDEVDEHYRHSPNTYSKELSHIHMVNGIPDISNIPRLIIQFEPKVLAIDVIEDLHITNIKGEYDRLTELARQLKQIANQHNIIVLGVHHLSKHAAIDPQNGKQKELNVHSGKGSSTMEQKADKVISIMGQQSTVNRIIKSSKARDEMPFRVNTYVNPKTFRFVNNSIQ